MKKKKENTGEIFVNFGSRKSVLDTTSKAQSIEKLDFIKIRNFLPVKILIRMKRQTTYWGKYTCKPDAGLVSRICKKPSKCKSKKINSITLETGKDMNNHFTKQDIPMANKHMKRWSAPLVIRQIQIKTTLKYYG